LIWVNGPVEEKLERRCVADAYAGESRGDGIVCEWNELNA